MATIVYLDAEDEITSAASRIRAAADSRVGLVIPFGSRVATSRINFRLLAREAMSHGRRLDIVAPDASARALAASAGLPVFASVGEYEEALDDDDAQADQRRADARAAAGITGAAALGASQTSTPAGRDPDVTAAAAGAAAGATRATSSRPTATSPSPEPGDESEEAAYADGPTAAGRGSSIPVVHGRSRRRPFGLALGLLLIIVVVGGAAAFAGYLLLPHASITVTPKVEAIGPVNFTVHADPNATSVDAAAGVVPAETLTIPAEAQGEFQATGKRVERTAATGGVRWTNCDPTSSYTIPSGTVVRTSGGIAFSTDEQVFLPVAVLSGGGTSPNLQCQTSEVAVTAVVPGPSGNVAAATIRIVPARYNRNVVRVNNPQATTGGKREEFTRISQQDVDAAMAQLGKDLEASFATDVANPPGVSDGMTVFPETAVLGDATPDVDPKTLVGKEVDSFMLHLTANGTVLAADASPAQAMAQDRLQASIKHGYELVPDSTAIEVGEGTAANGVIDFPVTATAKQVRPLDATALEQSVLGMPIDQAKKTLAPYGEVVIVQWPDWVTSIPSLDQRVTVTIAEPVDTAPAASPSSAPSPRPTPRPSASGDPSDGAPSGQPVPSAG